MTKSELLKEIKSLPIDERQSFIDEITMIYENNKDTIGKDQVTFVDDNDPIEQERKRKVKRDIKDLSKRIKDRYGDSNLNMIITNDDINAKNY